MAALEMASSPATGGFNTLQEEADFYKSNYENLVAELQDFRDSSKELEAELEKDVEEAEKRERELKKKVETLSYEVDEWKNKYKQSKQEASSSQNGLQKEITGLRDTNRNLQLKLRDIEVANDDYERQARHTTSSLEDMESKYNQTIERGVMLEEEVKVGEQERESLRIEAQRLRDELSDLKIEAEITQERLTAAEAAASFRYKKVNHMGDLQEPRSPTSEKSTVSESINSVSTPPPPKSESAASAATTPPSPPMSDNAGIVEKPDPSMAGLSPTKRKLAAQDPNMTPRPVPFAPGRSIHGRKISTTGVPVPTPTFKRSTAGPRPPMVPGSEGVPRSGSLYQIRGLIGKVQKLEQRVQNARSKLPGPTNTPPRASPRSSATIDGSSAPSNVTVRSHRKRASMSTNSSLAQRQDSDPTALGQRSARISLSASSQAPNTSHHSSRPSSRASNAESNTYARPASRTSAFNRPGSALEGRRPRSSLSGSYSMHSQASQGRPASEDDFGMSTPVGRRTTLERNGLGSNIPTPTQATLRGRQSLSSLAVTPARKPNAFSMSQSTNMRPPEPKKATPAYNGETF